MIPGVMTSRTGARGDSGLNRQEHVRAAEHSDRPAGVVHDRGRADPLFREEHGRLADGDPVADRERVRGHQVADPQVFESRPVRVGRERHRRHNFLLVDRALW